jgi:hypothetical protein
MWGVMVSVRGVVVLVMALLSFKDSMPGAYRLGASNAALSTPTSIGTFPQSSQRVLSGLLGWRSERGSQRTGTSRAIVATSNRKSDDVLALPDALE